MSPEPKASPVVSTASGKVRGAVQTGVHVFKGVPYGSSMSGARRFQSPAKADPWTGVRDAFELGPKCPQLEMTLPPPMQAILDGIRSDPPMGEDCLCLNVWSANLGSSNQRPVMVWLHGGGFTAGSGGSLVYDGTALAAKHDVVVVTLNHRLNIFGYLYLAELGGEEFADSGNAGMLDIVAALEWVRDNIAEFGGDPGNVTIFGESGGGMKVTALMAMPAAQGLFHRAIVQSGPFLRAVPRRRATQATEIFLATLGLKSSQVRELQNVPVERLMEAMPSMPGGLMALAPVADGRSLPGHPFDPAAPAISASVPLLIGSNSTEFTLFEMPPTDLDDATFLAQVKQRMRIDDSAAGELIAAYKKAHVNNIDASLAFESDRFMRINSILQAERKAMQGGAPVYMYQFSWKTPVLSGTLRSPHALEIPFVFDNVDLWTGLTGEGPERYPLADKMSTAWAAFAHLGSPGHNGLPAWPAYTSDRRSTMMFDNECRTVDDPGAEERQAFLASMSASAPV